MTWEKRVQKFHTNYASLPISGLHSWLVEAKFPQGTTNQKHYRDQGSDASSVCNRPFALKRSCDIVLRKGKLHDFTFEKQLVSHILNKIIVIRFFKPAPFSYNEQVRRWSRDQDAIFKTMNYLFQNTNFALKLWGKYWKDNVVTFTAHLSVTIKRLTWYN